MPEPPGRVAQTLSVVSSGLRNFTGIHMFVQDPTFRPTRVQIGLFL